MRRAAPWLFALASAVAVAAAAHAQRHAQRHADDELALDLAQTPSGPYALHEWGVWRLRGGQVDHLADLMREAPPFVHRASAQPIPTVLPQHLEVALKPVMFVYADVPVELEVTIGMPRGQPWLYSPDAVAGVMNGTPSLRWNVHALPPTTALPSGTTYPTPPSGHWWERLRAVGASALIPTGTHTAERFLFYDGPVPFNPLWNVQTGHLVPTGASVAAPTAWTIDAHGASRVQLGRGGRARTTHLPDVAALRTELRGQLLATRLTPGEVDALLGTWDHDLFQDTLPHAIWIVPQGEYEHMLPLEVVPRPRDTVRAGVVVQML